MVMRNIYKTAEHPFAPFVRILGKGKTSNWAGLVSIAKRLRFGVSFTRLARRSVMFSVGSLTTIGGTSYDCTASPMTQMFLAITLL